MELEEIIKQVNSLPFVEYDITMCNNKNCPLKDNCHRYLMCQTYKADTRKDKPRFFDLYTGGAENCTLFWEAKEFKL